LPNTRILFLSIKPSPKRWNLWDRARQANALIETRCKKNERLQYLDTTAAMLGDDGKPRPEFYAKDELHLSDRGYELWASLLKAHLK
jgi:lysophospholipase L1-like esterase